jgi:hypothetical protein
MLELPFHRLRKGAVFAAFLFFLFIFYRLLFFKTSEDSFFEETYSPSAHTEICLLVLESGPVNLDTIFAVENITSKIYAYSFLDTGFNAADTIWHVWYNGSQMVKNVACEINNLSCVSFVSADSLKPGDWSVDTRQSGILLNVKQFRMEQ